MRLPRSTVLLLLVLAIAGCAKRTTADASGAPPLDGSTAPEGTALAYEHEAEVTLPDAATLLSASEAVAASCREQRFGDCALLGVEQRGGDWPSASVTLRLAPSAVAPTLGLVTEAGGTLTRRTTTAEDLADAFADLKRERDSLQAQRRHLDAAVEGRTLSASDAIALAAESGRIDARLAELDASERTQQRRLDTNRLTIELRLDREAEARDAAFDGLGGRVVAQFADGVAEALTGLAYLLPLVLVLMLPTLGLALLWRRLWRWATRPKP